MCSSNHCFISTSKSPQDTPLFSIHILCNSLNELSSQSVKSSFLLSSIIHMYFAISWNEFFSPALFLYAFALLLQTYWMKFLNRICNIDWVSKFSSFHLYVIYSLLTVMACLFNSAACCSQTGYPNGCDYSIQHVEKVTIISLKVFISYFIFWSLFKNSE